MSSAETDRAPAFKTMELLTAILLGIAATSTAFATFQSALYSGRSVEAYARANKISTEAAAERSRAVVEMAKDNSLDVEAMRLTLEGDEGGSGAAERNHFIATYLYTRQMSDAGYKALGLPPEARSAAQTQGLQESVLKKAMEKDLADDSGYQQEMLGKSQALSDQAAEVFREGQTANETGDKFQLAAVLFAIALFFGGIVQVFHSDRMRQVMLAAGGLVFVIAMICMLRLPLIFS
jgi:hypothetical protein